MADQRTHFPDGQLLALTAVFAGSLVISAVLASKIITILGLSVPAGVLAYSITFVASDVVSEVWGKRVATSLVRAGFFALVVSLALTNLALWWPAAAFWSGQESFAQVLEATSRIIIASLVAYLVSQFHDVWAFHFWRERTNTRHLWLRNNLSTMSSQLLDSTIFITIAFWGVLPVGSLIVGQFLIKMLIALIDTPVVYLLVGRLRTRPPVEFAPSRSTSR